MSRAPVRILSIVARMNVGGVALHLAAVVDRLDSGRYESTLVSGSVDATEGDYLALHGRSPERLITVPELGRAIRGTGDLRALSHLVRIIRATRPHIVDTHTAKAGTLGRIAARICRVPVIVHTYHGHVLQGYFSPLATRVFVGIERALARVSTRLIAVSEAVRRDLLARGIGRPQQYEVVPYGFNLDSFRTANALKGQLRRELQLDPDTPTVGIVARLVPIKAHETFFAAARTVLTQAPRAHFVVVGDGERRSELEALASRTVPGHVSFLGWRSDLERLYADLDVVALTSRNEGSPVALIEAMAAARPVVSTRVGGVADVVQDGMTGILTPSGDAPALARGIVSLLSDRELRQRFGEAGQERAFRLFSVERLVGDLDAMYMRLLAEAGGR